MAGIFKAYDIRGIWGDTLTEDLAFRIGRAFVTFLGCRKVVVGSRHAPAFGTPFRSTCTGSYHAGRRRRRYRPVHFAPCPTVQTERSARTPGIMITASHNPGEWNGLKLCREKAIPISGATGIHDIELIVSETSFAEPAATPGSVTKADIFEDYRALVGKFANLKRPVKIAADMANGMGIVEAKALEGLIDIDPLFDELDGTFPNHEANPLKSETYASLQEMMKGKDYDFGVAYDGDADRVGFTDEKGTIIPMDIITALIAEDLLEHEKGSGALRPAQQLGSEGNDRTEAAAPR